MGAKLSPSEAYEDDRAVRGREDCQVRSDEFLLLRYRETGDYDVFAELVRRYEHELFDYLRRYLRDADDADDAFQATFLQLHRRCYLFDKSKKLRPWLYSIANHQAIDSMRRSRRHRVMTLNAPAVQGSESSTIENSLVSSERSPEQKLMQGEETEQMLREVERLPGDQRTAINLVYLQGMKYREAAALLGIPEGTLKTRVHTAVATLRRRVA